MSIVVDASVVIAAVLPERASGTVKERLRAWLADGEDLHAPAVLPYEVANVLAREVFDSHLTLSDVEEIWHDIESLDLVLHPSDLVVDGAEIATLTVQLNRRHATDSAYVCLACRLGMTLWTLDGPLARNAATLGLPVSYVD